MQQYAANRLGFAGNQANNTAMVEGYGEAPTPTPFLEQLVGVADVAAQNADNTLKALEALSARLFGPQPTGTGGTGPNAVPNGDLEAALHRVMGVNDTLYRIQCAALELARRL